MFQSKELIFFKLLIMQINLRLSVFEYQNCNSFVAILLGIIMFALTIIAAYIFVASKRRW